jgi:NitT/TauT family transport system substrate-binding protein
MQRLMSGVLLGVLVLASCGGGAAPSPSSSSVVATAPATATPTPAPRVFKYGSAAGVAWTSLPGYYAIEKDLFAKYGAKPQLVELANSTAAVQALIAGDIDAAFVGASTAIAAVPQGAKFKMVTSIAPRFNFVLVTGKDVTSIKQLAGTSMGTTAVGSLNHQSTVILLRKYGVDPTSVQFVASGADAQSAAALAQGVIKAAVINVENAFAILSANPNLKLFTTLAEEIGDDYLLTGVIVSEKLYQDSVAVQALVTGLMEASRYLDGNRDAALAYAKSKGMAATGIEQSYDFLFKKTYLGVDGGLTQATFDKTVQTMIEYKLIPRVVTYAELVDHSFIDKAIQQLGPAQKR